MELRGALGLVVLSCICLCANVEAGYSFQAHRLAQMDLEEQSLGSKRSSLYNEAVLYRNTNPKEDLTRKVAVLRAAELSEEIVTELAFERRIAGVLVVLPQALNSSSQTAVERELAQKLISLEELFISRDSNAAVYFTFETEDTVDMMNTLDSTLQTDSIYLSAAGGDPQKVPTVALHNVHMFLPAHGGATLDEDSARTIAIVAYYDSFSIIPSVPTSVDSNGSGTSALLELARLFSRLYASLSTQADASLLFVLTAGGHQNFAGARHLASGSGKNLIENVDFVLCLDTIGSGNELFLHYSKLPRDETTISYYSAFEGAAKRAGVKLTQVHKKINIADPEDAWEHEAFSRSKILAATLSRFSEPPSWLGRASIIDTHIDIATLERNVKIVANAIATLAYDRDVSEVEIFKGKMDVSRSNLESWMSVFSNFPRFAPHSVNNKETIVDELQHYLSALSADTSRSTFKLETDLYMFYTGASTIMSGFIMKTAAFEYTLTLAVVAYLTAIYVYFKGFSGLFSLFQAAKPKVKKF